MVVRRDGPFSSGGADHLLETVVVAVCKCRWECGAYSHVHVDGRGMWYVDGRGMLAYVDEDWV